MKTNHKDFSYLGHELALAKEWMNFCKENHLRDELDSAWSHYNDTLDKCRELKAIADELDHKMGLGLKVV